MWTIDFIVGLVSVTIGTVAFSILFGVRPKHLPMVGIGAAGTMIIYSLIEYFGFSLFSAAFISTVAAAVFSEFCARVRRAPAIVFLVPSLLPTIPGGSLYRAMSAFLAKDHQAGLDHLMLTLKVSIGIAGGIVTVSLVVKVVMSIIEGIKAKRMNDDDGDIADEV